MRIIALLSGPDGWPAICHHRLRKTGPADKSRAVSNYAVTGLKKRQIRSPGAGNRRQLAIFQPPAGSRAMAKDARHCRPAVSVT